MGQSSGLLDLLYSGLGNLAAYLAAHVLLCLLPAFFIAGAMTALIPKESVTRFLGRNRPKYISYPAAAASGSLLAVCSCTIVPLFAGIYKKGAGIGPAITFLFFAPAANILALIYTGGLIGADLAFARFFLSLVFGIGIGMIMALIFSKEDMVYDAAADAIFAGNQAMKSSAFALIALLVALLLSGTLKINLLTDTYATITLPVAGMDTLQEVLLRLAPFDPAKGEEGVSAQGAILIVLLALTGGAAWKGFETVFDGLNHWTYGALFLTAVTFLGAAVGMTPHPGGLEILITGKFMGVAISMIAIFLLLKTRFAAEEIGDFLWESWRFMKQIFPLLIAGVFMVGVIRPVIRPEWIQSIAGENTAIGNLTGVFFGIFMYFPTLVEVPIAKMFLELGMHKGPLLAYLMADPELSLQSMLITAAVIGRLKIFAYVVCVAIFSAVSGFLYGLWIDGTGLLVIGAYLAAFLAILLLMLWRINQQTAR